MTTELTIISLKGNQCLDYVNDLANLRIKVFRDYPYLYDGDLQYELNYLKTYMQSPECTIALVLDKNQVVGATTSIPMEFETHEFQKPFIDAGMEIKSIFYFGESVLLPAYRGQGIYQQFFTIREEAAKKHGSKFTTFCAVERDANDLRKPQNYTPLDRYWEKMGYKKHPEIFTQFEWKEIGEEIKSPKRMNFWMKSL